MLKGYRPKGWTVWHGRAGHAAGDLQGGGPKLLKFNRLRPHPAEHDATGQPLHCLLALVSVSCGVVAIAAYLVATFGLRLLSFSSLPNPDVGTR